MGYKLKAVSRFTRENSLCYKCWFYRPSKKFHWFYFQTNRKVKIPLCEKCSKEYL